MRADERPCRRSYNRAIRTPLRSVSPARQSPFRRSARSAYDRGPPDGRSSMASGPDPTAAATQADHDSSSGLTRRRLLGRAAAAGIVLGSSGVLGAGDVWAAQAAKPKRGGTLRIGMVGGGQSETLDPNLAVSTVDTCRMLTLSDLLLHAKPDLSLEMRLATDFLPNKTASKWTIKLRKGVVWHDGKPFGG